MIVATHGLRKEYGRRGAAVALDGVDLVVERGSVYGLIGPNGAGKTTLVDILSGLRRPTAGSVDVAVEPRRVSSLVDTPQFEPWLTAREVLLLSATLVGVAAVDGRVDEVLTEAGLAHAADRPAGEFSRGMLQRLGLAACFVTDPELLLLDEPCSALDPAGRREVLDTLRRLRGHATILLSTHLLGDVEEVCDTVGVLHQGRLLFQGALAQLLERTASLALRVCVRPPVEPALEALRRAPWASSAHQVGPDVLLVEVTSADEAETGIARVLADAGAAVVWLGPESRTLEQVFLEMTG